MVQPLWNTLWHFLIKLNMHLPYYPAILLLDREMKISPTPPKRDENLYPQKGMHKNIYSGFVHNNPKVRAVHMLINRAM